MTINLSIAFSSNGHFYVTTFFLLPVLGAIIFLILSQLFPLVSVINISYGKEHHDDSNGNLSSLDVMYDNKSQIFGKTYGDWTAEWWKCAYSIPIDENPAYDDFGINCNISQFEPVWFFSGTFNHSANRSCLVLDNVGILLPILNSECFYIEYPLINSKDGLMECAKSIQDHVDFLNATLDDLRSVEIV